jgi:hypothetical protein
MDRSDAIKENPNDNSTGILILRCRAHEYFNKVQEDNEKSGHNNE